MKEKFYTFLHTERASKLCHCSQEIPPVVYFGLVFLLVAELFAIVAGFLLVFTVVAHFTGE
jgi:hypothetical protein